MHHFVARLVLGSALLHGIRAAWVWERLRALHPLALAVCLMPDHLHLIAESADPDEDRRRLAWTLGSYARHFHGSWTRPPPPREIPDRRHLGRQIRYVSLNPCRSGLTDDPLRWLWSTHRDLVGATADPWVTPDRLAGALQEDPRGFLSWHHAYVSSDPTVRIDGTPVPEMPPILVADAPSVAAAAARATRFVDLYDPRGRRRMLETFFAAGRAVGRPIDQLAAYARVPRSTAFKQAARADDRRVAAAVRCLGDDRLLHPADERAVTLGPRDEKSRFSALLGG